LYYDSKSKGFGNSATDDTDSEFIICVIRGVIKSES
jgi:hypothetical protein